MNLTLRILNLLLSSFTTFFLARLLDENGFDEYVSFVVILNFVAILCTLGHPFHIIKVRFSSNKTKLHDTVLAIVSSQLTVMLTLMVLCLLLPLESIHYFILIAAFFTAIGKTIDSAMRVNGNIVLGNLPDYLFRHILIISSLLFLFLINFQGYYSFNIAIASYSISACLLFFWHIFSFYKKHQFKFVFGLSFFTQINIRQYITYIAEFLNSSLPLLVISLWFTELSGEYKLLLSIAIILKYLFDSLVQDNMNVFADFMASEKYGDVTRLCHKITRLVFFISIVLLASFYFLGEYLINLFFQGKYDDLYLMSLIYMSLRIVTNLFGPSVFLFRFCNGVSHEYIFNIAFIFLKVLLMFYAVPIFGLLAVVLVDGLIDLIKRLFYSLLLHSKLNIWVGL